MVSSLIKTTQILIQNMSSVIKIETLKQEISLCYSGGRKVIITRVHIRGRGRQDAQSHRSCDGLIERLE